MSQVIPGSARLLAAATTLAVVIGSAGILSPAAQATGVSRPAPRIHSSAFGIHSFQGDPLVPAGAIRMNCSPTWSEVNPAPRTWDWSSFDVWMARVTGWGIADVMFTFCATPQWAGRPVSDPRDHWFGAGSQAPVRHLADWRAYVRQVVARYGDRIDTYQVWNEANSRFMWQGGARRMAVMTAVAARVITKSDPSATIAGASIQLSHSTPSRVFLTDYLRALRRFGWPVDALAIHTYVEGGEPATVRISRIRHARALMRRQHVPSRIQLWDTETNILRPLGTTAQAAYVARAFLDSFRLGVSRTYWYMFTYQPDAFIGIMMRPGDVSVTAYLTVHDWTVGARLRSCERRGGVVACRFARDGQSFVVAYALRERRVIATTPGDEVCPVDGNECWTTGRRLHLGILPVRIS
jgi:hypothetical protein